MFYHFELHHHLTPEMQILGLVMSLKLEGVFFFQGDEDAVREELQDKILELLQKRAPSSTICPSEARELAYS